MSEWRYCRPCNGTGKISSGLWTDKEGQRVLVDRVTRTCERCNGEGILREPESDVEIRGEARAKPSAPAGIPSMAEAQRKDMKRPRDLFGHPVRPPREDAIHAAIVEFLTIAGHSRLLWFHPANGAMVSPSARMYFARLGVIPACLICALCCRTRR